MAKLVPLHRALTLYLLTNGLALYESTSPGSPRVSLSVNASKLQLDSLLKNHG